MPRRQSNLLFHKILHLLKGAFDLLVDLFYFLPEWDGVGTVKKVHVDSASSCVYVCLSFYIWSLCVFLPLCHHVSMYLSLFLYNNDNYPVLHVLCIMRQCLCLFVCLSLYVLVSLCRYSPLSSGLCCFVSLQLFLCLCLCTKLSTNYPLAAPVFLVGVPNPLALPHK